MKVVLGHLSPFGYSTYKKEVKKKKVTESGNKVNILLPVEMISIKTDTCGKRINLLI